MNDFHFMGHLTLPDLGLARPHLRPMEGLGQPCPKDDFRACAHDEAQGPSPLAVVTLPDQEGP